MKTPFLPTLALVSLSLGCGVSVSGEDSGDASREDRVSDLNTLRDSSDVVDARDSGDVADTPDATDSGDAADAADAADGAITVPCDPERPAPAGVGRSCEGGNAAHCREVHYCGGVFTAGHPSALVTTQSGFATELFQPCDYYQAVARSGYVDAYEVTVGRFRRWIDAGRPRPAEGTTTDPGIVWTDMATAAVTSLEFPYHRNELQILSHPGIGPESCTWTPAPGANENLPVNCVEPLLAAAFCWWDGKQLMNEVSYEYLATNGGRTETSFGATVSDATVCDLADVGALVEGATPGTTLCPRRTLPLPFDGSPRDVTSIPAGVFGLHGGMREWLYAAMPVPPGFHARNGGDCTRPFPALVVEGAGIYTVTFGRVVAEPYQLNRFYQRGRSWFDDRARFTAWAYATSRPSLIVPSTGADAGFRCQRWERPR